MDALPLRPPAQPTLPPALEAALPIRRRVLLLDEETGRMHDVTVQLDSGSAPPRGGWADVPLLTGLALRVKLEA